MIADLPATVVLGAVTGTGALAPIDRAQVLDLNGFSANIDAQLVLATAVFSTRPIRDQALTVTPTGGTAESYRVVSVQDSPDGVAWTLTITKDTR